MDQLLLDDFIDYKYLSSLKISPDSKHTVFICNEINLEENKYDSSIHILNNSSKLYRKLIDFTNIDNLIWKDETSILFSGDKQEDRSRRRDQEPFTCIYELDIFNGEYIKLFELPINISSIEIIDKENILFLGNFNPKFSNFTDLSPEKREEFLKDLKKNPVEVLDEIPFWSNGEGFTNKIRNKLYIYNMKNESLLAVTDDFTNVIEFKLDGSGENIVLVTNSYIDKKYSFTDLQMYNIEDDFLVKISPFDKFNYMYADFLGEKIIFFGSDMKSFGINENPDFYLCDCQGLEISNITKGNFNYSISNTIGSDCRYGTYETRKIDGDFLYFVTTEGDSSYIKKIDSYGHIKKLSFRKGSIDSLDVVNGRIQFIGLRSLRLQELYLVEGKREFQLTKFNQWVMEEKSLSIPEKLTFRIEDETLIEGWVMKPPNFTLGKSYPGILSIHGGPKTAYGEVFFHEMQYLANKGYVVFFCNPRGSDGRGNKFADIRGKYGTIDYEDIMLFTDLVLEKYHFIDRNRLGLIGGSYGGFMVNWIIGHSSRFKAAVSQRSISNWISEFGTTDIGYYFVDDQITSTPWTDYTKLWEHSPLKYADKISTPTLFIHSQEDYRCSLSEGLQMFTSLKYHGVESRFCIFKEENHELSRSGKPKNRIRRLEEISAWLEKYLK